MSHFLEILAHNNMAPNAQPHTDNSMYSDAMRTLSKHREQLLQTLNEEEKALFEKYRDAQEKVKRLATVNNWIHGYKLGLLITAEAFVTG